MRMPPSIGSLIISYFAGSSASQVDAKRRRKGHCPSLAEVVVGTRVSAILDEIGPAPGAVHMKTRSILPSYVAERGLLD